MNLRHYRIAGIFLLLAALHLFLYSRLPDARRDNGWATIVMHNWHEYGVAAMDGQLVANPGGLDAGEEQFVYPGHRATFLYLPYVLKELPGAALGNGLLYDLTVLALTYAGLLWLLGTGLRGLLTASVVCLTPGFINNVVVVDTINVPALLGLAAMGFAGGCLARKETPWRMQAAAVLVACLFMLQNWSTLFSLGVAATYVLCRRRDWWKVAGGFAPPLLVGLMVLMVSMHSRHTSGTSSGNFWNAYLWGPLGYDGTGMTFGKALVRITAVNVLAWLSVGLAGLALLRLNGLNATWRRAPWPLLAGIAAVFAMRNYNAHHPWGAISIIGLGLVFSLELLIHPEPRRIGRETWILCGMTAMAAAVYLIAWLALDEYNKRGQTVLQTLVLRHTPRHSLMVVANDLLPAGPVDPKRFSEPFDRKVVSLEDWTRQAGELKSGGKPVFLVTHDVTPPAGATLIAESRTQTTWADRLMIPLFDFYRTKISRRASGDRKVYFDDYRLYALERQIGEKHNSEPDNLARSARHG